MKTRLTVVGDIKRSGAVVLAATPLLKKEGIKTGSCFFNIPKRKDIHVVNRSMERYIKALKNYISSLVLQYVAPKGFDAYSSDELFIDATASLHLFAKTPEELAHKIINEIYRKTRLTATAGIGPNLLLAKVSLDHKAKNSPRGVAYWRYEYLPFKLWSIHSSDERFLGDLVCYGKAVKLFGDLAIMFEDNRNKENCFFPLIIDLGNILFI
ncbi:DNA damage repair protein [Priestia aryabhattai]|uniref:Y-family DNA polymerase n=1 Tax=Priestia aryabhattai TaxID=412384 RepID=UPI002E1AE3A5|nr:DNA damage repair protein [Priestia aryabhattai]